MEGVKFWAVALSFILGLFALAYWLEVSDREEMVAQHCQQTGRERESFFMQYVYDEKGNIMMMYPVFYTEYEFKCDDHNRWR